MKILFRTHMLLKCVTKRKYATDFLKYGKLRFAKPQEWIDVWKNEGSGRGDLLEGAFATIMKPDNRASDFYKLIRPNTIQTIDPDSGHIFFQSKDVLNLRTCCFFGLNDNMFTELTKGEDGVEYPSGRIKKNYFQDFAKNLNKELYEECKEDEKATLIMITKPKEFRRRFEKYFTERGLKKEEIIYAPVNYINKKEQFLVGNPIPEELLFKDIRFSNQSEIRIIINTKNDSFLKNLDNSNGIIELGNMEDITNIEEYYFQDFIMQKRKDSIMYSLPKPKITVLSQEMQDLLNNLDGSETLFQVINGKEYPLTVEKNEQGEIICIYP